MNRIAGVVFFTLLSGCAGQAVDLSQLSPQQAHCYQKAKAAAAGVYNSSLVWQMAMRNGTEVQVYRACMAANQ